MTPQSEAAAPDHPHHRNLFSCRAKKLEIEDMENQIYVVAPSLQEAARLYRDYITEVIGDVGASGDVGLTEVSLRDFGRTDRDTGVVHWDGVPSLSFDRSGETGGGLHIYECMSEEVEDAFPEASAVSVVIVIASSRLEAAALYRDWMRDVFDPMEALVDVTVDARKLGTAIDGSPGALRWEAVPEIVVLHETDGTPAPQ